VAVVCKSCSCCPFFLAYLVLGSAILHSHSCHWASAVFSRSALIRSSLVCHNDWQDQTSVVATDAVEPEVPSEPSTSEPRAVNIWVGCDR
jgi:hypothetical protein